MDNRTLKKIVKDFRNQNKEVFPILYDEFGRLISFYAYKLNFEDAHQELMLFFIELLNSVNCEDFKEDSGNGLSKYIAVAIRNKYIALSKAYKRDNLFIQQNYKKLANEGCANDLNLETTDILKTLTNRQRAVVVYKYVYLCSDVEISRMLGISRQAVNGLKNRALEELRKLYNG